MERYQKIIGHEKFQTYVKEINQLEQERIYCHHDTGHLLDVARIDYIKALEEGVNLTKDEIYGAALLHDIGKVRQYKEKIPHEITGAKEAGKILRECGYKKDEIGRIEEAILHHRRGDGQENDVLSRLLYEADKQSRMCMFCKASESCNWGKEQKNVVVIY